MVDHKTFQCEYEAFWSLAHEKRDSVDGAFVALIFVMLAMGTQFAIVISSPDEKEQQAEFWGKPFRL